MVRRILPGLAGLLAAGLLFSGACRSSLNFPPRLVTGTVSDTARLIKALPESGCVYIAKNGYRTFDLDAIVADEDDADSTIRWSLTPGPGLEVKLNADTAEVGPAPNQVVTSYVVFGATDPGGLSASRTCPVSISEFRILVDSVAMGPDSTSNTVLDCDYRTSLKHGLIWEKPVYDSTRLKQCSLSDSAGTKVLRLRTRDSVGITGVYLRVSDPVNNVGFHHSIRVRVR
jgi:hypothetical protein